MNLRILLMKGIFMAKQVRHKIKNRKARSANEYHTGICKGLQSAIEMFESGQQLTFDKIKLAEKPKPMTANEIVSLRKELHVSQRVLASILNVSAKTVQAWEQKQNRPSGASLRLLQVVGERPAIMMRLLG